MAERDIEPVASIAPVRTYVSLTGVLIVLTLLSVGLAQVDLHGWNSFVALVIASVMGAMNALFFMHLRSSQPVARLVGAAALLWLGILIVGTLDDVLTRGWLPVPGK
jgi:cytochrome c oxidase subunit IV